MPYKPPTHLPGHSKPVYPAERAAIARQRADAQRGSSSSRGYDREWRDIRAQILRDEPLCRMCVAEERLLPNFGEEVDHIKPIARGGARLDRENLQPLCREHHSRKTAKEDGGFGR